MFLWRVFFYRDLQKTRLKNQVVRPTFTPVLTGSGGLEFPTKGESKTAVCSFYRNIPNISQAEIIPRFNFNSCFVAFHTQSKIKPGIKPSPFRCFKINR